MIYFSKLFQNIFVNPNYLPKNINSKYIQMSMPTVFGVPLWIFIIIILFAAMGAPIMMSGGSLKKATTAALNMDMIKGGYKAYKKIKG